MEHINFLISVLSASAEDYPALENLKRVVTASAEFSSCNLWYKALVYTMWPCQRKSLEGFYAQGPLNKAQQKDTVT
jgi:hypothetical protein